MKKILTLIAFLMTVPAFAADKTIVRGTDHFELVYEMTLPKLAKAGTLWIPLARTDAFQKLQVRAITSPVAWHKTRDAAHQNNILVLKPTPADSGKRTTIRYQVTRKEKQAHAEAGNAAQHLKVEKLVPLDISEADKHPELAGYYFGHHPANRLEVSRGRDITVTPVPKSGPFNYFFGPHLEVEGKQVPVKATFEFKHLPLKD